MVTRVRVVAVTAAVAVIVAAGVTAYLARAPGPGALPTATPRLGPTLLVGHHLITDVVPGGAAVIGPWIDAFEIFSPDGTKESYPLTRVATLGTVHGPTPTSPAFDGVDRIAYWSRASKDSRSSTLDVWSATTHAARIVFEPAPLVPDGDPVWSSDGTSLYVSVRDPAFGSGAQLLRVDPSAATATKLLDIQPFASLSVVFAGPDVIAALRSVFYSSPTLVPPSTVVLIDAKTGTVFSERKNSASAAELRTSPQGLVVELQRNFETASGPLHVWSINEPDKDIARLDGTGYDSPLFWPGRREVVYFAEGGMYALEYATGKTRRIFSGNARVIGFDATGERAVLATDDGYIGAEREGVSLKALPGARYARGGAGSPIIPLAVLR